MCGSRHNCAALTNNIRLRIISPLILSINAQEEPVSCREFYTLNEIDDGSRMNKIVCVAVASVIMIYSNSVVSAAISNLYYLTSVPLCEFYPSFPPLLPKKVSKSGLTILNLFFVYLCTFQSSSHWF